jgi:hypothetical protein
MMNTIETVTNAVAQVMPAKRGVWQYILENILNPIVNNLITYNKDLFRDILIALAILLVGWLVAKLVQVLFKLFLKLIRFDDICDKTKFTNFLENAGIRNIPSNVFGDLLYWIILLIAFLSAVNQISDVSSFQKLQIILKFFPSALLALFIVIIGIVLGYFFGKIIKSIAVNSGAKSTVSVFLEKTFFIMIVIFSGVIALKTVFIDDRLILGFVDNIFKYALLGIAIAFGLGTRGFAEDFLAYFKIKSAFPKGTEIMVEGERAIVKEIGIFHTMLYTDKGVIDMPNATLSRKIVKKITN